MELYKLSEFGKIKVVNVKSESIFQGKEYTAVLDNYFASIRKMQEQMFHILAIAASVANLFGVILNALLRGNALPTQVCVICGVIILAFSLLGLFTKFKDIATIGILGTVVWAEFPFLFCVYGEVIFVYFVLSIIGIVIFYPRKFSLPFCTLTVIWDILVIIFKPFQVDGLETLTEKQEVIFNICSYLIVAASCLFLLDVLILKYEQQKQELNVKNSQLDYYATHDPLTDLYNRGYLIEELKKRIRNQESKFTSIIMDIDDFKVINDTYGHMFGDEVLRTFAKLLAEEVEGKGFAARFGGEEFMLVFDGDDQEAVLQSMEKIAEKFENYFQEDKKITITFSAGLEIFRRNTQIDEIIGNADRKLYQAKRSGKKQIIC